MKCSDLLLVLLPVALANVFESESHWDLIEAQLEAESLVGESVAPVARLRAHALAQVDAAIIDTSTSTSTIIALPEATSIANGIQNQFAKSDSDAIATTAMSAFASASTTIFSGTPVGFQLARVAQVAIHNGMVALLAANAIETITAPDIDPSTPEPQAIAEMDDLYNSLSSVGGTATGTVFSMIDAAETTLSLAIRQIAGQSTATLTDNNVGTSSITQVFHISQVFASATAYVSVSTQISTTTPHSAPTGGLIHLNDTIQSKSTYTMAMNNNSTAPSYSIDTDSTTTSTNPFSTLPTPSYSNFTSSIYGATVLQSVTLTYYDPSNNSSSLITTALPESNFVTITLETVDASGNYIPYTTTAVIYSAASPASASNILPIYTPVQASGGQRIVSFRSARQDQILSQLFIGALGILGSLLVIL